MVKQQGSNALAGGTGVTALAAVVASFAGKTIIRTERQDATAEYVDARGFGSRRPSFVYR